MKPRSVRHNFHRLLSILLIEAQMVTPWQTSVLANLQAEPSRARLDKQESSRGEQQDELSGPKIKGASTPPETISFGLRFSPDPSDSEFFSARIFDEALVPTETTNPQENKTLAAALIAFSQRHLPEDASAVRK